MIFLLAGWVVGFLAGVFVMGLLRASAKQAPVAEEHLHDWYECPECRYLLLLDFWTRHEVAR